jgi:hypothetical protein
LCFARGRLFGLLARPLCVWPEGAFFGSWVVLRSPEISATCMQTAMVPCSGFTAMFLTNCRGRQMWCVRGRLGAFSWTFWAKIWLPTGLSRTQEALEKPAGKKSGPNVNKKAPRRPLNHIRGPLHERLETAGACWLQLLEEQEALSH